MLPLDIRLRNRFRAWLQALTTRQRERIYRIMGANSDARLRQLAMDHGNKARRLMTVPAAVRIEQASIKANAKDRSIRIVRRDEICSICHLCPYAQSAQGGMDEQKEAS